MWMAGKALVDRGTEGRLVRGGEGCTGGGGKSRHARSLISWTPQETSRALCQRHR